MVNPGFNWESFSGPTISTEPENKIEELPKESSQQQEENESDNFQWGNFQSPETYQGEMDPDEEGNFEYLVRNLSANASRIGEQVLGSYGNMEQMGKDILTNLPESAGVLGWA